MLPTSQTIVVLLLAAIVLASRCVLVWHALASGGRADEARHRVRKLAVLGSLVLAFVFYGGSLVEFDLLGFRARAAAGSVPWESFYMACVCTGIGALLFVFFLRGSSGFADGPPQDTPED